MTRYLFKHRDNYTFTLYLIPPRIYFKPPRPDRLWSPFSLLSKGYRGAVSPGVKLPGHEADHSPPSNA